MWLNFSWWSRFCFLVLHSGGAERLHQFLMLYDEHTVWITSEFIIILPLEVVVWYTICCMRFASAGTKLWSNVMEILDEKDGVDTELLVYAMTLVNKVGEHYLVNTYYYCHQIVIFIFSDPQSFRPYYILKRHTELKCDQHLKIISV